jgi:hypothetical protein
MFKANLHRAIFMAPLPLLCLFLKMWHEVIPLEEDDQVAQCWGERLLLRLPSEARYCLAVPLPAYQGGKSIWLPHSHRLAVIGSSLRPSNEGIPPQSRRKSRELRHPTAHALRSLLDTAPLPS